MNPCVPLPCVASTDTDPSQPAADDPDIIDIPWLFTDSDIENADPPPGGWNLGDSYDIGTDEEESITKTTPLLKPIAPVLTTPAVAKHATVPLLPTTTLPASTSAVRAWASQTASSPMIPTARILAKVKQSPLRLRGVWRKHLSVSDIVSVAWCELQVDYSIRGLRHLPLAERPKTFKSREGKTIAPKVEVAQTNSERMDRGTAVHKKLEKEIAPIQIVITAKGKEEMWALRLMNIIVCFRSLATLGACREMPVFGFLKDTLVLGVIDEIVTKSSSELNIMSKTSQLSDPTTASTRNVSTGETTSLSALKPAEELAVPQKEQLVRLFVLDSKTRGSRSLPPRKDMKTTRMQLMIYRQLLCDLLYPTRPPAALTVSKLEEPTKQSPLSENLTIGRATFDFVRVWSRAGINFRAPFSDAFSAQLLEVAESNDIPFEAERIRTVEAIAQLFDKEVSTLKARISGVSRSLEVTYRTRKASKPLPPSSDSLDRKRKRSTSPSIQAASAFESSEIGMERLRRKRRNEVSPEPSSIEINTLITQEVQMTRSTAAIADDEDFALQAAIAMSLADSPPTPPDTTKDVDMEADAIELPVISSSQRQAVSGSERYVLPTRDTLVVDAANGNSIKGLPGEPASDSDASSTCDLVDETKSKVKTRSITTTGLLGVRRFRFKAAELGQFVARALDYWSGVHDPVGVEIENIDRCMSCEYIDDCEWRAKKAQEAQNEQTQKRSKVTAKAAVVIAAPSTTAS